MNRKLKKDIVIPAGTEFSAAPKLTRRHSEHLETIIAIGPDNCGSLVIPVEDDEHFRELFD